MCAAVRYDSKKKRELRKRLMKFSSIASLITRTAKGKLAAKQPDELVEDHSILHPPPPRKNKKKDHKQKKKTAASSTSSSSESSESD